jgi:c-di-GMP-binding flagellar brake protein YcgR
VASSTSPAGESQGIQPGARGLLLAGGARTLVAVLSLRDDCARISYPTRDFPVEGMEATLEFHDAHGYAAYACTVEETPRAVGDGLLLRLLPGGPARVVHRAAWRVPLETPATLKSHVHPRRVQAKVLNISATGMLVAVNIEYAAGENIDFALDLPGSEPVDGVARVVHITPESGGETAQYGLEFVGMDPVYAEAISRHVWSVVTRSVGRPARS